LKRNFEVVIRNNSAQLYTPNEYSIKPSSTETTTNGQLLILRLRAVGTTQHEAWVEPYSRLRGASFNERGEEKVVMEKATGFSKLSPAGADL
jgi:hypothetical protein